MQIRALSERVTRIRTDILVLGFFRMSRPVRGLAGEVDWIYNGIFSRLMKLQKLKGHRGEAMLLASESKLLTPKVLLIGLGSSHSYNDSVLLQVLLDVRNRLTALKVETVCNGGFGSRKPFAAMRHSLMPFFTPLKALLLNRIWKSLCWPPMRNESGQSMNKYDLRQQPMARRLQPPCPVLPVNLYHRARANNDGLAGPLGNRLKKEERSDRSVHIT